MQKNDRITTRAKAGVLFLILTVGFGVAILWSAIKVTFVDGDMWRQRAEELHVDPAVIANRATVTAWVDDPGDPENPLAGGWRYEVVGRDIAEKFEV